LHQEWGYRPPFSRYFFFDDMHAWRQNLSWHDIYIGDRLHGAVVAFHAGRPAVVICKDVRSEEIASYYDLPSVSLAEATSVGLGGVIEEQLSHSRIDRMKNTFVRRAEDFRNEIEKCGLQLNLHV
jgi:polysaccharide pyruvyl transferase WcaK-like protein